VNDSTWGAFGMSARRLGGTLALAAGCAVAMLSLLGPSGASASYARCHGGLAPDEGGALTSDPNGIVYTFYCNHKIKAYTIWSSLPIDYFTVDPLVYTGPDPASSDVDGNGSFACEGKTPSRGFGCQGGFPPGSSAQGGTSTKNEAVQGGFVAEGKLCATNHEPRPKVYFSVVETQFDATGKPYQAASGPFRMPNGCQASGRHTHHHHH
jgi:hypothetical protein